MVVQRKHTTVFSTYTFSLLFLFILAYPMIHHVSVSQVLQLKLTTILGSVLLLCWFIKMIYQNYIFHPKNKTLNQIVLEKSVIT